MAEDEPTLRDALASFLASVDGVHVVGCAEDASQAVRVAGSVSVMLLKYCAKNWPVVQPFGGFTVIVRTPDVWPSGDIALVQAVTSVKRLRDGSATDQIAKVADSWRPLRSVAARMMWQHYLAERSGRRPPVRRPDSRRTAGERP